MKIITDAAACDAVADTDARAILGRYAQMMDLATIYIIEPGDTLEALEAKRGWTLSELAARVGREIALLDSQHSANSKAGRVIDFEPRHAPHLTLEAAVSPLWQGDHLAGSVVTFRDITRRKERERDLKRKAFVDDLTQVNNRAGFYRQLDTAIREDATASLALIDLDWFKSINDTFGHASGDQALVVVADIIKAHVHASDCVGRLGGDEFAILLRSDGTAALGACQRIADEICNACLSSRDHRRIPLSISCGVATTKPGQTRETLFEMADAALYAVKEGGRNGVQLAA